MIKKSILVFLVLVVIWAVIIRVVPFSISQHQWQENIVCAEKYIYGNEPVENVIIGSSLSRHLQMDSLAGFYNMALGGQGVMDGLHVLMLKKELPEFVFVETNYITLKENKTFLELVSSPVTFKLKRNFKILRADKQPLAVIGSGVIKAFTREKREEASGQSTEENHDEDMAFFNKLLNTHKHDYNEPVDPLLMDQQFRILNDYFQYFKSHGVQVVLYEMPVNPQLVDLPQAVYLRKRISEDFSGFAFIALPDNWDGYTTSDGVHLTDHESVVYTEYFKCKLAN